MNIALTILTLILCVNVGALMLCFEVESALIVASATTGQTPEEYSVDPRLLKAQRYSGYASYLLLGGIPFFGLVIGQCFRSYKTEQSQIIKKQAEQAGDGDAEEAV